jgi:Flp pilus assembly pilin Flp
MKTFHRAHGRRRGAALVEYGLIIAGVALVAAAAVSIFGTKTSGMIGMVSAVVPGAHAEDNGPIETGKLIQTTQDADGTISIDTDAAASGDNTLGDTLGIENAETLVPQPD